jgi:imidazolonepropionase-like amidohydrolase
VHTISGESLENATLLFEKSRITAVGRDIDIPANAERIEISGEHVYPGLFDSYSNIGLVEINAVRATRDMQETGLINPNAYAHLAVNPDSEIIPVTRANGVLLSLVTPDGGLITGQSAVLQLDGWTYEDLTLKPGAGLHIAWPDMTPRVDPDDDHANEDRTKRLRERLDKLEQAFADARAYLQARKQAKNPPAVDLRWESMQAVLNRKSPLIVEAEELAQIQAAVAFAQQQKVRLIIYGGYDAADCASLLKQYDVPVIVGGVYRLPRRRSDPFDAPYTLPARLHAAGVTFCISGSGRFGASNARNLPYHAGTAVAYGLPREVAVKSITLAPAEILGVGKQVGSLEQGKQATLFICSGDPLESDNQVTRAFVQGREVDLSSRHTDLWQKYRRKYEQK